MKTKIFVILAIIIAAAALNALYIPTVIRNTRAPESPQHTRPANLDAVSSQPGAATLESGVVELNWSAFESVKVKMNLEDIIDVNFSPEMRQFEGKTVRLAGVGFFLKDGIVEKSVHKFIMLPPKAIIWCCVPTPKPHPEWTILVDSSANPWPMPETAKPFQVAVQGTLALNHPKAIDYLYTIADARIVPLRPEEILDTSGLNICEETSKTPSMQTIDGL